MEKNNTERHDRFMERFKKYGIGSLEQYEMLELLLGYACSNETDIESLTEMLMYNFGSLASVLDAPHKALIRIPGMKEGAAVLLNLIPNVMRRYGMDKLATQNTVFNSIEQIGRYCTAMYFGTTIEIISILLFSDKKRLLGAEKIQIGSLSYATLNYEKIAEILYAYDATYFVMVHNHPDGVVIPSEDDLAATDYLAEKFKMIDKIMLEHIIVSGNNYMPILKFDSEQGYCELYL